VCSLRTWTFLFGGGMADEGLVVNFLCCLEATHKERDQTPINCWTVAPRYIRGGVEKDTLTISIQKIQKGNVKKKYFY
jgi:hypothetical protein